jgi:hypothetical protein
VLQPLNELTSQSALLNALMVLLNELTVRVPLTGFVNLA